MVTEARARVNDYFYQTSVGLEMDRVDEERLIEDNLGIVKSLAMKYAKAGYRGCDFEELVAVGNLRLVKCAKSFDDTTGVKFSTYAYKSIEGEILSYIHKNMAILSVPVRDMREMNKNLMEQKNQGAEAVALDKLSVLSIDSDECQETGELEPGFDEALNTEFMGWLLSEIQLIVKPKEYDILCKVFGLNGAEPMPRKDVAKELGVSPSRIGMIIDNVMRKIRNSKYIMSVLVDSTEIGAKKGDRRSCTEIERLKKYEAEKRLYSTVRSHWEGTPNV